MAIITFNTASPFPTTPFPLSTLRKVLTATLPDYKWQCGEEDLGGKADIGRFHEYMLIAGRSPDTIVFTDLRTVDAVMPGAPQPHLWHLKVGTPTTEIQLVADRVVATICCTLMTLDQPDSRCQLHPGGNWLTADDLQLLFERVFSGETLSPAAESAPLRAAKTMALPNIVAAHEAEAEQYASGTTPAPPMTPLRRPGGFGRKGL